MSNAKAGMSHRSPFTDERLLAPAGVWEGITCVNKFGENHNVATDSTETIWEGSNLYPFPATALITSMSQTADQLAMRGATIEVQGLDADWNLVIQNADLDGTLTTNVVTLSTPLIRVFRAKVMADVVSDQVIRIHNAGETVDYAIITAGENQTTMAIYTVPANFTAYLTNYYSHHHPATNQNPTSLDLKLYGADRHNGYAGQLKHTVGVPTGGAFHHPFVPYMRFTQKTDIYMTATTVGKAAHVSAGFDLYLLDNRIYGEPS